MNQSSETPTSDTVDRDQIAARAADLEAAREHLVRAAAEYEALLADDDTIQEDRDAAAQFVAEARAGVTRAEAALTRAEAGTHGRCERCGSPIPSERLAALADATTCVSCA